MFFLVLLAGLFLAVPSGFVRLSGFWGLAGGLISPITVQLFAGDLWTDQLWHFFGGKSGQTGLIILPCSKSPPKWFLLKGTTPISDFDTPRHRPKNDPRLINPSLFSRFFLRRGCPWV